MGVLSTSSLPLTSTTPGSSATGAFDPRALDAIRVAAKGNDPASTRKVAQQFESMFLSMMLKGMRATLPGADPLANEGSKLATDLYDQQLAQTMSKGKGIGLADALVAQIERAQGQKATAATDPSKSAIDAFSRGIPLSMTRVSAPTAATPAAPVASTGASPAPTASTTIHSSFIDRFKDAAMAAAEATGLPAKVILGQAALESGWGKHEVRGSSGAGSFNLFGIKAGPGWAGATVDAVTTEFVGGVAQKVVQKFRAYASYAESFIDYAKTVTNNPRYEKAVQAAGDALKFAAEMGRSGYATDPDYGAKLARVLTGPLGKML